MDIIYTCRRATAEEVRAAMASPPTNAAVRATLRALVEKGHLNHAYDGPRYVYTPTVSHRQAQRSALQRLVRTFFNDSAEGAMTALLELKSSELSEDARNRLKEMIDHVKSEGR